MTDYLELPDYDNALAGQMSDHNYDDRDGDSAPLGAVIINWRTLSTEHAPAAWRRLRTWVEWFSRRYDVPLSTIPICWWKHPALVEELSALHTAHTAAFDGSDTGFGPIGWHERLAAALPRLTRAYAGGCSRGHNPDRPRTWDGATDEAEWTAWTSRAHAD